jgi:hypothetical protein
MGIGTNVGYLCQDTTTTTGTGVVTITGAPPTGAPPGSTSFAAMFAPTGVYQLAGNGNQFYAITDGSGNIEVGLGTLLSATTFSRDYVLGSYTGGLISSATQTSAAGFVNFAAGTKNIYSNTSLFAASVAYWSRIPDDNTANIFECIMSGSFVGVLTTGSTTANATCRYKVTNDGICYIQVPIVTVNGAGTNLIMTGIPSFLSNVATQYTAEFPATSSGANVNAVAQISAGATPTSTGTLTFQQGATFTATWTTSVVNGFSVVTNIQWPLY